uniref:Ribosomal protein L21 n=2 Tax=Chromera velia TaxID=505693 RepID=A0A0G4G107_9ALVE|eukprot:Cvel_4018.t1-p1 / transcript=Cvel_4018.t1 / gene=Cvel_4018 / organism=Chromera_velia_CCMP2878 / gene_product=50S ribosomal protein L21, chloroplastic, putative / transcript_product=50S ribosomal protein L21, chloroplastic, putative / location=Cvel_scaffold171:18466-18894(-) / protein_length=143 / sequence_SO=supercontig / SO=protein_coding / is_pseudo=false
MELGRFYDVYRLDVDIGKPITLNRVLLYKDTEGDFYWGHPFLEHVRVHATVLEHFRGPKVKSFKFKAKTKYRRLVGHRQEMTRIRIDRIELLDHKEDPTWTVNKDPLYALMKNVYAEKKCQGTNFAELAERVVYDDHYIPNPV